MTRMLRMKMKMRKIAGSGDIGAETTDERYTREKALAARRRLQWCIRRHFIRLEVRAISKSGCCEKKSTKENRQQSIFTNIGRRVLKVKSSFVFKVKHYI